MHRNGRDVGVICFGSFVLRLDSGELFKKGHKIKLQGQPFELLAVLAERPDQVVTRRELREAIWPKDTVVDFDRGLNRAIKKIRDALGDSAAKPRFIETLQRRGYRFVGAVEAEGNADSSTDRSFEGAPSIGVLPLSMPMEALKSSTWRMASAKRSQTSFRLCLICWLSLGPPCSALKAKTFLPGKSGVRQISGTCLQGLLCGRAIK